MVFADNIHKSYGDLEVLKGISLQINQGEVVSLVGPSGAGKSTLLNIIGTLDKADSGMVKLNGEDLSQLSSNQLADFRNRNIGFVFQFHHLLPEFTAIENVLMASLISGMPKKAAKIKAKELLDRLGLSQRVSHYPSELSGGEQQRVAVARALMNDPALILADEPSGNLDSQSADSLHQLFFELREELNQTFVIVTHNQGLADMADRKLLIVDGIMHEEKGRQG